MYNVKFSITVMIAGMLLTALSCKEGFRKPDATYASTDTTMMQDSSLLVSRGEYLVNAIGCADCHSPKRMGPAGPEIIPELHLSGFQQNSVQPEADTLAVKKGWVLFSPDLTSAVGPWGQSFAANITSDPTGIGNWSEEQFLRAMREGKFKGLENSRTLLPPMPWPVYRNLTDEDIRSIYFFLMSTKPVKNVVPWPKTPVALQ